MATIKDVARLAGVSVATVSRVINHSPKASQSSIDSVTVAMKSLGYRPNAAARALVSQSSNTIGILVSDVSDPFFGSLVKAVDNVAQENGKQILIGNGYHEADKERKVIELLINNRCDALVIHSKRLSDQELISFSKEIPSLVLINRHIPEIADRCISLDNEKGAYIATEYLIQQGHRNIACIASTHHIEDAQQRINGYLAALKAHGIVLNSDYIESAEPNSEGGEKAMSDLLCKSIDISAVVAYNDNMAAGAISVLEEHNVALPDAMSVIGFDDATIARYVRPRLTTILYPIQEMAEKATTLALELARGEAPDSDQLQFTPSLVQRDSVSPL
ncbi:substrate-binding domain-containing protein [Vibrio sp. RC27]